MYVLSRRSRSGRGGTGGRAVPHKTQGSLRNKIIAWSFVPTAVILVLVALVSLLAYRRVTERLVVDRDRDMTGLAAQLLATELAAYTDPFSEQFLTAFDDIVAFDASGQVMTTEPLAGGARQPAWLRALPLGHGATPLQPVFSRVFTDRALGEQGVVVFIPLGPHKGGSAGGIAGYFRLGAGTGSVLYRSVEKLRREEGSNVYLVDSTGRVIHHTQPEYIGVSFAAQEAVQKVLQGISAAHRTHDAAGREIVASFAPVPGTSWALIVEEDWSGLIRPSRRYGHILILLLGLGILIPTAIVSVGTRRITQPIAELIRAAQEMAGGHFGRRIAAHTGDEIEELAGQFNCMAAQLQESYTSLERKVADRTRELATLNAIAAQASRSLELPEVLGSALDVLLAGGNFDMGQAFRLDQEGRRLVPIVQRGRWQVPENGAGCLPLHSSLAGQAATRQEPVLSRAADRPGGEMDDLAAREQVATLVSVPLIAQGRSVGVLNLGSRSPEPIQPEELSILAAIGQQTGVAVENAYLYEQAQQLAIVQERNRLARDLHDSVTQALYGISLYAEAAARQLGLGDGKMAAEHLAEIRTTAQESLREMRLLIFELRPPMLRSEGLVVALQARLEAVEARVGVQTRLQAEGEGPLSPQVEDGLYRIAQEALNNALKHARASSVALRLVHGPRSVLLEIADDGAGFDPAGLAGNSGFGLRGMDERAARLGGTLVVDSAPGRGTRVRVEVCP
jgi:signal transduction histidine kinase